MSEGVVVAVITSVSIVVSSIVTWAFTRKRQAAEASHESAAAVHETVAAVSAVLAVYKTENQELREAIEDLKVLNKRLEEEVQALRELCAKTQREIATKIWRQE